MNEVPEIVTDAFDRLGPDLTSLTLTFRRLPDGEIGGAVTASFGGEKILGGSLADAVARIERKPLVVCE